jgi:tetratricopeptide (TPR) repeat protein
MKKISSNQLQRKIKEAYDLCAERHFDQAEIFFKLILKDYPSQVLALSGIATIYFLKSEFNVGIEFIEKSLRIDPHQPDALNNYSIALRELGRTSEALTQANTALKIKPNYLDAYYNRGLIYSSLGNFESALMDYNRVIQMEPRHIGAHLSSSFAHIQRKEYIEAISHLDKIIATNPNNQECYFNYGLALLGLEKDDDAKVKFDLYLKFNPEDARTYYKVAHAFLENDSYEESLKNFNVALKINPSMIEALNGRGRACHKLRDYDGALKDFNEALNLDFNNAEIYNNKGLVLIRIGRLNEAENAFKKAIDLDPNYADSYNNLGVLNKNSELDESIRYINEAIKLKPNQSSFKFNLALIYLAHKKFHTGWELYKNRDQLIRFKRDYPNQANTNEIFNNDEKLLLLSEQGLGDQILFLSMLNELLCKKENIDIVIDNRLVPIFKRTFPDVNFISNQSDFSISSYKQHLLYGALGSIFRSELDDFKWQPQQYLKSDQLLKNMLKDKINKGFNSNLICGISWKSKNEDFGENKSLQLKSLIPILQQKNITFINLQYGETRKEISEIKSEYNVDIKDLDEINNFHNIDGLFSLIDACDLVITTSNATAHMSGAIGKKTFLLVPYLIGKMWYWHEDDTQSIWYPSISIFRQKKLGDWEDPINKISELLKVSS